MRSQINEEKLWPRVKLLESWFLVLACINLGLLFCEIICSYQCFVYENSLHFQQYLDNVGGVDLTQVTWLIRAAMLPCTSSFLCLLLSAITPAVVNYRMRPFLFERWRFFTGATIAATGLTTIDVVISTFALAVSKQEMHWLQLLELLLEGLLAIFHIIQCYICSYAAVYAESKVTLQIVTQAPLTAANNVQQQQLQQQQRQQRQQQQQQQQLEEQPLINANHIFDSTFVDGFEFNTSCSSSGSSSGSSSSCSSLDLQEKKRN